MQPIWIGTGEAARLGDYSRAGFRRKFEESFIACGVAYKKDNGYVRWLRVAVLHVFPDKAERHNIERVS